jgi:hypothetical protein
MSIIMNAIGGFGEGLQSVGKDLQDQDMAQLKSNLELNRQEALAQFTNKLAVDTENQKRQSQVDRIGSAQKDIINQLIAQKANNKYDYTDESGNSSPASYDELPDDDKANPEFQPTDKEKQAAYREAAIKTGDLDPKTVISTSSKEDIAELKNDAYRDKIAMSERVAQIAAQSRVDAMQMRLDAEKDKRENGKISASIATAGLTSENKNIDSTTRLINTLTRQMADLQGAKNKPERDRIQAEIDGYKEEIKESKRNKSIYLRQLGITSEDKLPEQNDDQNAPIGVRQNNPGNLRNPNGTGFQSFSTPQQGFDALQNQLLRYARGSTTGKPLDTVQDIISTWAPPSDNNDTAGYIKEVSAKLGVAPDAKLNIAQDPDMLLNLSKAIADREVGPKYASKFYGASSRSAVASNNDPLGIRTKS